MQFKQLTNLLLWINFRRKILKIQPFFEDIIIYEKFYMEWTPRNRPMYFEFGPLNLYVMNKFL